MSEPPADAPVPRPPASTADADAALVATLERLDRLGAVSVHEHVQVFADVDHALRERLSATER